MKWERETQGRRQIVVHRCFCIRKEGEVTLGGRWPMSEERNLPPVQPGWESTQTAPALRRHPEIMSHTEKLGCFHPWKQEQNVAQELSAELRWIEASFEQKEKD